MALEADDLLEPAGVLTPDMFPGQDARDIIGDYIEAGYARADEKGVTSEDDYARAYAYARSFGAHANRMAILPASASLTDQGSQTYSSEQLRSAQRLAEQYRLEYVALEPVPNAASATRSPGTQQLGTAFSF